MPGPIGLWKIFFSIGLLILSGILYYVHFLIFKDAHHIFIYLLGDIAFVPVSVLLVSLVIEHILEAKQKETISHKLNMVLGAFFSEVGQPLLKNLQSLQDDNPLLGKFLQITTEWKKKDFLEARRSLKAAELKIDLSRIPLLSLRDFLAQKRNFLLVLIENPNLLEHAKITDMLWAIFHLTEELLARKNLSQLTQKDREHLSRDLNRAYGQLLLEWVEYMRYLQIDYPYLYSLAVRTNPFSPDSSAEIL